MSFFARMARILLSEMPDSEAMRVMPSPDSNAATTASVVASSARVWLPWRIG